MAISKKKKQAYINLGIILFILNTISRLIESNFKVDARWIIFMFAGLVLMVLILWLFARFTGLSNWDEEKQRYVNSWKPEK